MYFVGKHIVLSKNLDSYMQPLHLIMVILW